MKKRLILFFIIYNFCGNNLFAYVRDNAVRYAEKWWNTDIRGKEKNDPPDQLVDHINNPNKTGGQDLADKNYLYYNRSAAGGKDWGSNTVHHKNGAVDCSNFVSQCLIAGGINFSNVRRSEEGTVTEAAKLWDGLQQNSQYDSLFFTYQSQKPPSLTIKP